MQPRPPRRTPVSNRLVRRFTLAGPLHCRWGTLPEWGCPTLRSLNPPARADGHLNLKLLFNRVYPGLVRYLYRRLGDRDLAEDIAQEAFVRLLRALPDNPDGWLFVVAANLARDSVRVTSARARKLTLLSNSLDDGEPPERREQPDRDGDGGPRAGRASPLLSERDRTPPADARGGRALSRARRGHSTSSRIPLRPLLPRARSRLLRVLTHDTDPRPIDNAPASA